MNGNKPPQICTSRRFICACAISVIAVVMAPSFGSQSSAQVLAADVKAISSTEVNESGLSSAVISGPAPSLHLGPRVIPLPKTISKEAASALLAGYQKPIAEFNGKFPPHTDKSAWKKVNAESDAAFALIADRMLGGIQSKVKTQLIDGVTTYVATPNQVLERNRARVALLLHGGAFVRMGGRSAMALAAYTAAKIGCVVYAVDYRMPPDFPYPHGVNDIIKVYRDLLKSTDANNIVMYGASAGGNLAAATTLKIRDQGLPLPGLVVLLSPEADLTESGDSFQTNLGLDPMLRGSLVEANLLYADGHDLRGPYLSPLFADFARGFPPTLIQSGTRDLFLSNAVRLHRALRKANVEAELHLWEGMPHGGFGMAPEDEEVQQEIRSFMDKH